MLTNPIRIPPAVDTNNCSSFSFCFACGDKYIIAANPNAIPVEKTADPAQTSVARIAPMPAASKAVLSQSLSSNRLRWIKYEPSSPVVITQPIRNELMRWLFIVSAGRKKAAESTPKTKTPLPIAWSG